MEPLGTMIGVVQSLAKKARLGKDLKSRSKIIRRSHLKQHALIHFAVTTRRTLILFAIATQIRRSHVTWANLAMETSAVVPLINVPHLRRRLLHRHLIHVLRHFRNSVRTAYQQTIVPGTTRRESRRGAPPFIIVMECVVFVILRAAVIHFVPVDGYALKGCVPATRQF
ncbi:MAG TPA: hypothetical protein DC047_09695 [Blastocatellia bacterium]|nr:hypothetical protein [Blastocatellia bacterium]